MYINHRHVRLDRSATIDHSGSESDGGIDEPRTPANGMKDEEPMAAPESKSLETVTATADSTTVVVVEVEH